MQKILVTGGVGYIGSHTVVELLNSNFEVYIIDDLSNSDVKILDNIKKITGKSVVFEQFNLKDKTKLADFFERNSGIKSVIHFAALKAVGESVEQPLRYYHDNLVSLMNLLSCMEEYQVENLVFSSSCTVYGQPEVLPVTEQSPILPAESPYGNTKKIAEDIITDFIKVNPGIKATLLRYFNPVGAHESALIGELPLGVPNNLMPIITQVAAGVREKLTVFGNNYNTKDGTCIRDFIHVVDLAKAHIASINRMIKNENLEHIEIFNAGTGNGFTVLEIIESFERVSGVKLNYSIGERRAGDIEKIWANTSYINKELGWKAEKTLDDMTLSSWNWQKNL